MKCRLVVGRDQATTAALGDPRRVTLPLSALAHAVFVTAVLVVPAMLSHELPAVQTGGISVPVFVAQAQARRDTGSDGGGSSATSVRPPKGPTLVTPPQKVEAVTLGASMADAESALAALLDDEGLGTGCVGICNGSGQRTGGGGFSPPTLTPTPAESGPIQAGRGGVVREPRKSWHVEPIYPPLARAVRLQGRVLLTCTLAPDGSVQGIEVTEGSPLLAPAAVEAVRAWRYTPTLLNGVPVAVRLTVVVDFRLS